MQTATKYIGGHSDTLGGVLAGSRQLIKRIFDSEYLNTGSGIQPFNAWLLLRGLRTLPARLERIGRSAAIVVEYLARHEQVEGVLYPLHPSFENYELAKRQMKGAGGLMSFYIRAKSRQEIVLFCESLKHIMMAVSWGGHESLILPACASMENEEFDPSKKEHRLMRLYVGLEDPGYLIADLDRSFSLIK
jgi:cystathionine beta-lyase/cystathionine gamma-synthase